MREKIQIVLSAALLLALGMTLGYWFSLRRPLPPPGWVAGPPEPRMHSPEHPARVDPAQIERFEQQLRLIGPRVAAFQDGFTALDADFHGKFDAILTPEQRALHADRRAMPVDWQEDFARMAAGRAGLPLPPMERLPGFRPHEGPGHESRALFALLRVLMYEPTLRVASDRYHLDAGQQARLRVLLEERRRALLALMDQHPLPLDEIYFVVRDLGLVHEDRAEHPEHPAPPVLVPQPAAQPPSR